MIQENGTTANQRESVFAEIVVQSSDGIVLIDCESRHFVEFNDAACIQLGYSRDEFTQLTIADVSSLTDDEIDAAFARILEVGFVRFQMQHRRKDGTLRTTSASNHRIVVLGRPYVAATWHDLTEHEKSLDALRISEQRQRMAVTAGGVGLWDLDLVTGEANVNDIYAKMLGEDPATWESCGKAAAPLRSVLYSQQQKDKSTDHSQGVQHECER
jgi:PAS domain S-box-containing protein